MDFRALTIARGNPACEFPGIQPASTRKQELGSDAQNQISPLVKPNAELVGPIATTVVTRAQGSFGLGSASVKVLGLVRGCGQIAELGDVDPPAPNPATGVSPHPDSLQVVPPAPPSWDVPPAPSGVPPIPLNSGVPPAFAANDEAPPCNAPPCAGVPPVAGAPPFGGVPPVAGAPPFDGAPPVAGAPPTTLPPKLDVLASRFDEPPIKFGSPPEPAPPPAFIRLPSPRIIDTHR